MATVDRQRPTSEPPAIWLKQRRETALAFAAFVVYRDQDPPRNIGKVAKFFGRHVRTLHEWSRKFDWLERADAYSAHLDALRVAENEDDVIRRRREENEALYQIGKEMQMAAATRVVGLKRSDDDKKWVIAPLDPNTFDVDDTVRMFESGTKAIRLSQGLSSDFMKGTVQISIVTVQAILVNFVEIAQKHMTPEGHEALVRELYAAAQARLGQ